MAGGSSASKGNGAAKRMSNPRWKERRSRCWQNSQARKAERTKAQGERQAANSRLKSSRTQPRYLPTSQLLIQPDADLTPHERARKERAKRRVSKVRAWQSKDRAEKGTQEPEERVQVTWAGERNRADVPLHY